jgi:hypothetical protein
LYGVHCLFDLMSDTAAMGVAAKTPQRSQQSNSSVAAAQLAAVKSGAVQMFGVNLGSWLVLEQYMVPSIYAMVSGSPYGERQLLQVLCADPHVCSNSRCAAPWQTG